MTNFTTEALIGIENLCKSLQITANRMNIPISRTPRMATLLTSCRAAPPSIGVALVAAALLSGGTAVAAPPGSGWTQVWADEFNGSSIDTTKWGYGQLPWGGNHHNSSYASTIVAANSYLDSGNLVLGVRPGSFPASDGTTQPYSSGMIYSQGKFDYAYGYCEVSAKFSSANGSWPAFWMLKSGWPPEIDVAEWFKSQNNRLHTGLAYDNSGTAVWDDLNTNDGSIGDTWHTWALDWAPGRLAIYKDGADQRWSTSGDRVPTDPMYFLLNSGVQTGVSSWWHDTLFDYIRVWKRNQYVYNGNFETWNGPWNRSGNTSVVSAIGRGGGKGLRLYKTDATDCYAEQPTYGLKPNTDYIFTGWGNVGASTWPAVRIGVKNHGGAEVSKDISSNGFTQATLPFTTGATNTTASVFAWMPTMWGNTVVDDFNVRPAANLTDRGFEGGDSFYYWTGNGTTYGNQFVANYNARSGGYCSKLSWNNAPAGASGVGQDVVGLAPNTTYKLSAWGRNNWQGTILGVKNFDGTTSEQQQNINTGDSYGRGEVTFTTGASNTTATIYAWFNTTARWADAYIDDFFLAEPLPADWSATDVGTVVLQGESGKRGTKFIVQGSGADVWGAADACRFLNKTLTGDGSITARLRSMEATGTYCKAGIMLRENLTAGSRQVSSHWMNSGIIETIRRPVADNASAADQIANVTNAPWLRVSRSSNTFTPAYSTDGTTWLNVGAPQTIAMGATLYAGLFACANSTTALNEAVLDNVTVFQADSDLDGLPDSWEMAQFGSLRYSGVDDPDGDGDSNAKEFATGTQANNGKSFFKVSGVMNPSQTVFTLTWPSVPGKSYLIQSSTNLNGTWTDGATVAAAAAPATATTRSEPKSASVPRKYYRVKLLP